MNNSSIPNSTIVVYRPTNSKTSVELTLDIEQRTVWPTQRQLADALGLDVRTVSEHIGNFKKQRGDKASRSIRKFRILAEDGKNREVEQYDMTVVTYVGFRAQSTEKVMQFQDWVGEQLDRIVSEQQKDVVLTDTLAVPSELDIAELMIKIARQHEDRIKRIEARQDVQDQYREYMTVRGYANYIHRHVDNTTAAQLSKKATDYCNAENIHIGKVKDTVWGSLKTYPDTVLKIIFDNWYSQMPLALE